MNPSALARGLFASVASRPAVRPPAVLHDGESEPERAARRRVLLVEDDASLRAVLRMVLEAEFEVVEAAHGGEALERLGREHFDAVLLDLMMPVMSGEELIGELRARELPTPVVVMTASLASVGREDPVVEVLRKPFDLEDLEGLLRTL